MHKVLFSSCLLGNSVRYNASCLSILKEDFEWLSANVDMVVFCPEISAGMPIPRAPAEITNGKGQDVIQGLANVMGDDGIDVTKVFLAGAKNALKICQQKGIKYAVLAEGSPSCGSTMIYDGSFSGNKIEGAGVTTAVLEFEGIKVFSQYNIASLKSCIID